MRISEDEDNNSRSYKEKGTYYTIYVMQQIDEQYQKYWNPIPIQKYMFEVDLKWGTNGYKWINVFQIYF